MKTEALFLFLILLSGLILASFLGTNEGYRNQHTFMDGSFNNSSSDNSSSTGRLSSGRFSDDNTSYSGRFNNDSNYSTGRFNNDNANSFYASLKSKASAYYDNYNHYTGTTASSLALQNGLVFTDAVGDTVTVSTNSNGLQMLELSQPENSATMVLNQSSTDTNLFNAPFGNVNATVVTDSNNQPAIQINLPNGETIVFTQAGTNTNTDANTSSNASTQYYGSTGSTIPQSNYAYQGSASSNQYYGPYGGTAGSVTGPAGNTAYYAQGPAGNTAYYAQGPYGNAVYGTNSSGPYYNTSGSQQTSANQYYGPYGGSAGSVTGPAGNTAYYAQGPYGNAVYGTNSSYNTSGSQQTSANQYYGPYGGSAGSVTGPEGNTAYYAQGPAGNTVYGVNQSQDGPYYNTNTSGSANQYYGPNGGSAGSVTGPEGNTAYYAQGPNGNTVTGTTTGTTSSTTGTTDYGTDYYSTLPEGISKSQIPAGQEDAYILKSEIVPPVCPACSMTPAAASANCPRQEPCPPCPACARCPEPSFECKKVPNYSSINEDSLPMPVLSDFSQFGM